MQRDKKTRTRRNAKRVSVAEVEYGEEMKRKGFMGSVTVRGLRGVPSKQD